MNERVLRLAERIRSELADLDRLVARLQQAWAQRQRTHDDLYLDSIALNLHGFYAGLERLFELVAAVVILMNLGSIPAPRPPSSVVRHLSSDVRRLSAHAS